MKLTMLSTVSHMNIQHKFWQILWILLVSNLSENRTPLHKLNMRRAFRRGPGRLLIVSCTFS